ncbi:heterokaryon incompatibility protein-domain-containing protein [Apiospora arundinis]
MAYLGIPPGFRVIDVVNLHICQPLEAPRFVALSYMWSGGGSDEFQLLKILVEVLETPGSLANAPLPGVITDTMALCRDMGERYLWVDRLCIVQDDAASKMIQIQAMDTIYQSATLTIATALDCDDGTGIPGYKGRSRYPESSTPRPIHKTPKDCSHSHLEKPGKSTTYKISGSGGPERSVGKQPSEPLGGNGPPGAGYEGLQDRCHATRLLGLQHHSRVGRLRTPPHKLGDI